MRTHSLPLALLMLLGKLVAVLLKGAVRSWGRGPHRRAGARDPAWRGFAGTAQRRRASLRPARDVQDVPYRELPAGAGPGTR